MPGSRPVHVCKLCMHYWEANFQGVALPREQSQADTGMLAEERIRMGKSINERIHHALGWPRPWSASSRLHQRCVALPCSSSVPLPFQVVGRIAWHGTKLKSSRIPTSLRYLRARAHRQFHMAVPLWPVDFAGAWVIGPRALDCVSAQNTAKTAGRPTHVVAIDVVWHHSRN